jgi:hypothetical protein
MYENESINYKKYKNESIRSNFASKIRLQGIGHIPIVIDSIDKELSTAISSKHTESTYIKYGLELSLHMDNTISDIINIIKEKMIENNTNILFDLYLEDNSIPIYENSDTDLGSLYKKHRNPNDKILYILIKHKITIYQNILYNINNIFSYFSKYIYN